MSGTTWSKFFWGDWESDPALRLCSFAAQGLWMRMLCIAAHHDPIGYIAVNNEVLSANDLARMVGGSESEVPTLLDELERNGVLSRNRKGMIFSRRMVRDDKKSRTARENGKTGGNPSLLNQRRISPSDKGQDKPQIPSASSQEPKQERIDAAGAALDPERDLFVRAKQVLGNSAGGMVKNLIKAKGRVELARAAIEMAATKGDPREYIGAIIRGREALPDQLWDRGL